MKFSFTRDDCRYISILGSRIIILILVNAIFRWIFYGYNYSLFGRLQTSEVFRILAGGLRFDLSLIAYINLPLVVLSVLPFSFRRYMGYQYFLRILFLVVNGAALLLATADMEYYSFNNRRITLDLFMLANEVDFSFRELIHAYWFLFLMFLITLAIMLAADIYFNGYRKLSRQRYHALHAGIFLLVLTITFFLGRGGITGKPLSAINASNYVSFEKSALVTNSPFVFLHSFNAQKVVRKDYFPPEELTTHFTTLKSYNNNLDNRNMNVVVIIWESLSAGYVGSLNDYPGYTPFLDSLMAHSLVFSRGFANAERSNKGIPAILSSFPSLMSTAFVSSTYQDNCITGISNYLKKLNYHCSFFHGGNRGTMNFYSYTKRIGFDAYFGREEFGNDEYYDGIWGIWDEHFLQYFAGKLNELPRPFFSAILTLSSHHPYIVPAKYGNRFKKEHASEIAETMSYTDYSLGEFFRKVAGYSWFSNTLFVITADHPYKLNEHELAAYDEPHMQFRVPIIFYCPGKIKPEFRDAVAQQVDIMPSVLDYVGFNECFNAYGISLFSDTSNIAYQFDNAMYLIQDEQCFLTFDGTETVTSYEVVGRTETTGKEICEDGSRISFLENKIKAIIQTYNNQLVSNSFCGCK